MSRIFFKTTSRARSRADMACITTCSSLKAIVATVAVFLASGTAHSQSICPDPSGSGVIDNYCYDSLGRLIAHTRNDGANITIEYDDAGNRVSQVTEGGSGGIVIVIIGGRPMPIVVD